MCEFGLTVSHIADSHMCGTPHAYLLQLLLGITQLVLGARVRFSVEVQQSPAIESVNHLFLVPIPRDHANKRFCCSVRLLIANHLARTTIDSEGMEGILCLSKQN